MDRKTESDAYEHMGLKNATAGSGWKLLDLMSTFILAYQPAYGTPTFSATPPSPAFVDNTCMTIFFNVQNMIFWQSCTENIVNRYLYPYRLTLTRMSADPPRNILPPPLLPTSVVLLIDIGQCRISHRYPDILICVCKPSHQFPIQCKCWHVCPVVVPAGWIFWASSATLAQNQWASSS